MGEAFFTEVPGPIPFGGLDSDRSRSRSRSTSPTGSSWASAWTTTSGPACASGTRSRGPGVDMFGIGTLDRPWLAAGARPDGRGAHEDGRRVRVLREARHAVLLLPRSRRRPRDGRELRRRSAPTSTRSPTTPRATRSGPACGSCGAPPTCSPTRATRPARRPTPIPRCSRYAAAQVKHMLEVTQRLGGAELRPVGRPRGLRHPAQHGPPARGRPARPVPAPRRRAQAQDRLRGPAADRAQADGADQAPVRLRRRDRARLPRAATGSRASTGPTSRPTTPRSPGHSFHHEVAFAAANGMLGSIDANRGDPQNGWDTDQFPNSVEDLVLPLYEILRAGGIAPGGFNFDAKLRRQSTAPERPVPRPHRRPRHARPGAARRGRHGRAGRARRAQGPALRRLGRRARARRSSAARVSLADLEAQVADGAHRPRRARRAARSASRTSSTSAIWAVDRRRPSLTRWASSSGSTSPRRRPRRSSSTPVGRRAGDRRRRRYGFEQPHPLWSEQDPHLWWTGAVDAIARGAGRRRASTAGGRRGRRAHRPDARARPARRRGRGPATGDPVERPAHGRRVRRDPRGRRPGAPRRDHRQRRADRLHGPQAGLGAARTSPRSGPASPTCCCPRTTSATA